MSIPATCEADLAAAVTPSLVQLLFDRPGFQQEPHCTSPTGLAGGFRPPAPYRISHHHGKRDAVPVAQWRIGRRIAIADFETAEKPRMIISADEMVENVAVPPPGGHAKLFRTEPLLV